MLVFRLKKVWFDKIKSGEKTHEYRKNSLLYKISNRDTSKYYTPNENLNKTCSDSKRCVLIEDYRSED